ncbi:Hsp20 family protein [Acidianus sulfidivorans JP7]|uniref:Heat-shock protein Hsp20 n=1 Tax=Acidianus sulfidivorans JP7 TaxID=619593 RepID=A0A2U9IKQ0_9CREN|nr:archaeal heat shock protein Hsp20 [Acidianus sulfidivorans]AWR96622.1 Hsp20 family protein [Acidianus sulfidivorans JP7]
MSSKKKRYSDIFDYFDDMIREIEEEFENMEKEFFKNAGKGDVKTFGPYVYGFSVTIGPDGKPVVEEFGNVKRLGNKPIISEEREPLVDVIEKGDEVRVIAEVPGVDKNNIKVKVNGVKLTISAQEGDKKFYKEVELPAEVDENSAKANYKNGVLEIIFKKKETNTGKEIKVE